MSNVRLLPTWIPDEECKALIAWIDNLEIGEVKKLKSLAEENECLKAQNELQLNELISMEAGLKNCHDTIDKYEEALDKIVNGIGYDAQDELDKKIFIAKEALGSCEGTGSNEA